MIVANCGVEEKKINNEKYNTTCRFLNFAKSNDVDGVISLFRDDEPYPQYDLNVVKIQVNHLYNDLKIRGIYPYSE